MCVCSILRLLSVYLFKTCYQRLLILLDASFFSRCEYVPPLLFKEFCVTAGIPH